MEEKGLIAVCLLKFLKGIIFEEYEMIKMGESD